MSRVDTSAAAAHTPECQHPATHPGEPRGYTAWFEWVECMAETHEQKFCEHCKRWNIWEPNPQEDE